MSNQPPPSILDILGISDVSEFLDSEPFSAPAPAPEHVSAAPPSSPHQSAAPYHPSDVVSKLIHDYLMVLENPNYLDERRLSEIPVATGEHELPPMTPDEQVKYAALFPAHYTTEEILHGRVPIEQILDSFGTDRWVPPLEPEPEDILMMFAPAHLKPATAHLPETTRREHHASSIGSHVHVGNCVPAKPESEQPDEK